VGGYKGSYAGYLRHVGSRNISYESKNRSLIIVLTSNGKLPDIPVCLHRSAQC